MDISSDEVSPAINFGLGVYLFKEDLFDLSAMADKIQDRMKEKLAKELLEIAARGETPTEEEIKTLSKQLLEEVKDEIKRELDAEPSSWPRARFQLQAEGTYREGAGQLRLTVGLGLGRAFVGPSLALEFDDELIPLAGLEMGTCLLWGKGVRAPVVNLFGRYDRRLMHRDTGGDQAILGIRMLLDII